MDPLAALGRKDKWYLGSGSGSLFAPGFPRHLLAPGFWDPCLVGDIELPRLFTAIVLNERGRPIRFDSYLKGWRPNRLTIMHYAGDVVIRERRCVTEAGAFVSEFELVTAVGPLDVVTIAAFRAPVAGLSVDPIRVAGDLGSELTFEVGALAQRLDLSARTSPDLDPAPTWEASFLPSAFVRGRLDGVVSDSVERGDGPGVVQIAQRYTLDDRRPLVMACSVGRGEVARTAFEDVVRTDPLAGSEASWRSWFSSVPHLESSDPWLQMAYWYRWYVCRLNAFAGPTGLRALGRGEGIDEGAAFIDEMRWAGIEEAEFAPAAPVRPRSAPLFDRDVFCANLAGAAAPLGRRFHDGAPTLPHGYAWFDPVTGVPDLASGLDDVIAGRVVDPILRGLLDGRPFEDVDWIECIGRFGPHGEFRLRQEGGFEVVREGPSSS